MTEHTPAFLQEYKEAVKWLESWQENGFDSMTNAEVYMRQEATQELERLQNDDERFTQWTPRQSNIEMWQGWLSALDGYRHWINPIG
jgi:ribonuclease HI